MKPDKSEEKKEDIPNENKKQAIRETHHILIIPNDMGIGISGILSNHWMVEKHTSSVKQEGPEKTNEQQ